MDRRVWIFFGALAALVIGIAVYQANLPPVLNGATIEPPKPMADFTLQSARGPVKLSDFRGRLVVVFFGYTNCTDICPLTMAALRQAFDALGDQAAKAQVVFISVDYKRDTAAVAGGYASNFRPDFIGLSGSKEQIDQVTSNYGIYYELGTPDPQSGAYEVAHTDTIEVLDGAGRLVLTWTTGTTADQLASDLKVLIKKWIG
jgi:protein SCO1/2